MRRLTLAWRDDLGPIWVPMTGGARTVVVVWPMQGRFVDVDALESAELRVWEIASEQLMELRRIHESWSLERHDITLVGHRALPTTESLAAWVGFRWLSQRAAVIGEAL